MAARHSVLKEAACESTCVEPCPDVTALMSHRKDCISAAWTDDDASSVRISCRIDFKDSLLILVAMRIVGYIIGKCIRSSIWPNRNGFLTRSKESGSTTREACRLRYSSQ